MAASVSTRREVTATASVVSEIIQKILDRLGGEDQEQIGQWIKLIEEHAERLVHNLSATQFKRRKVEVIAAAAVYDAFLEYESRTSLKLNLNVLHEIIGSSECSINTAWQKLFDTRVSLRGNLLDFVYTHDDTPIPEVISSITQRIVKAVVSLEPEVESWLQEIEAEAIELSKALPQSTVEEFDILTVGLTLIYAATQQHQGKMRVQITQRTLSLLSSGSPAMISKCWLKISKQLR